MKYEDQEDAEASGSGLRCQQGGLATAPSRASESEARPGAPRWRLKRSIQVFESTSGALHLLRLGLGNDLEIEDPQSADRLILRELSADFASAGELEASLGVDRAYIEASLENMCSLDLLDRARAPSVLDARQAERYDRQLIYFADLDPSSDPAQLQRRLSRSHVLLIGCGGLGSWVACGLATSGVGQLTLVDDDRVELSNLNRQLLFNESDIGRLKVEAAAEALSAHRSDLAVTPVIERMRSEADVRKQLLSSPDLVIATADWPPHDLPRWVNAACVAATVPWLGAGQFPPKLRVGPMVLPGRSPCLACHEQQIRANYPLYDEIAEWRARGSTPDASVGPVSGVIGTLLASEAMHLLLGAFTPASVGSALLVDLQTMSGEKITVEADPDCDVCLQARGD